MVKRVYYTKSSPLYGYSIDLYLTEKLGKISITMYLTFNKSSLMLRDFLFVDYKKKRYPELYNHYYNVYQWDKCQRRQAVNKYEKGYSLDDCCKDILRKDRVFYMKKYSNNGDK